MGHSNPAMTRHYTHVGELAAAAAVGALPSVMGGGDGAQALPAGGSAGSGPVALGSEIVEKMKALAEQLNGKNWKTVRAEMLALAGA